MDRKNIESIGKRLARIRKAKGYTQNELAIKMNINRSAVSNHELGRLRLYDEIIKKFAIALGVSADIILGITITPDIEYADRKVTKRVKEIEKLPYRQKISLLNTIDAYLKSNREKT